MGNIYTGIVTYNPDLARLKDNISTIQCQVPIVLIFDNGSNNIEDIRKIVLGFKNTKILESRENVGIAAALNRLMQWGYENCYDWMLSLDQDSVCPNNYISAMKSYLTIEKNLGVVAPVIVDRNIGVVGHEPKVKYAHVNTCITSGAFSKISAWKQIGEYDESMFIDSVDFEFCYRMKKYGYGIIQVKDVHLLHEIGQSKKRKFFWGKITVSGHNAFRKYYIARNNVYYPMKHKLWLHFFRGNWRNLWGLVKVLLFEDNKKEKVRAMLKGWKDAYMH